MIFEFLPIHPFIHPPSAITYPMQVCGGLDLIQGNTGRVSCQDCQYQSKSNTKLGFWHQTQTIQRKIWYLMNGTQPSLSRIALKFTLCGFKIHPFRVLLWMLYNVLNYIYLMFIFFFFIFFFILVDSNNELVNKLSWMNEICWTTLLI